jgi:two-component system sensor histidine kinase ResE
MRDLLANVSHDLRTPLTSIQGFAGALVDGTLRGQDGAAEAGRVIGEEAERMRRLVEDLLYLGRIEAGDIALVREPLDLADLAAACGRRFTFRAEETGVRLDVDATTPVFIAGDGHRLAQVLDNLLENAFKHTPQAGEIAVRVAASPAGPPGPRSGRRERTATLTVHNTGSVIEAAELERVFERFYQVDKARAAGRGRGLGLAIARQIVQAHGGTLTVESSHSSGTAFTATFPLLEQPQSAHLSSKGAVRQEALTLGASPRRN